MLTPHFPLIKSFASTSANVTLLKKILRAEATGGDHFSVYLLLWINEAMRWKRLGNICEKEEGIHLLSLLPDTCISFFCNYKVITNRKIFKGDFIEKSMTLDGSVRKIARDIEKGILRGEVNASPSGKIFDLKNCSFRVPEGSPDGANVYHCDRKGINFSSVVEGEYDVGPDIERTRDFIEYVNSQQLGSYELGVEYIDFKNGKVPDDGKLGEMGYDDRINVRPLRNRCAYKVEGKLVFKDVKVTLKDGRSGTASLISIPFNNLTYFDETNSPIDYSKRFYTIQDGEIVVQRRPILLNVNRTPIEEIGRVPLEVVKNLLEPYTSQRLLARAHEYIKGDNDKMERAISSDDRREVERLQKDVNDQFGELIRWGFGEEEIIGTALVKSWLIKNNGRFGINNDDITAWSPFQTEEDCMELATLDGVHYINTHGPADFVEFFTSDRWLGTLDDIEGKREEFGDDDEGEEWKGKDENWDGGNIGEDWKGEDNDGGLGEWTDKEDDY